MEMEKCRKIVVYRIENGIVVERTREGCYSGDNEVHAFENAWSVEAFLNVAVARLFTPQELRALHAEKQPQPFGPVQPTGPAPATQAAGCPSTE